MSGSIDTDLGLIHSWRREDQWCLSPLHWLLIPSTLTADPPHRINSVDFLYVDYWSPLCWLDSPPPPESAWTWGWSAWIVDPLYIDCQFVPPRICTDPWLICVELGLIHVDPGQICSKMCIVGISWCIMGNPLSSASQLHVGSVCISFVKSWIYEQ